MKPIVILDLDDTLLPSYSLYVKAKEEAFEYMSSLFNHRVDKETIAEDLEHIDVERTKKHGYIRQRFPFSFVKLYMHYCKTFSELGEPTFEHIEKIHRIVDKVFDCEVDLIEGTEDVINKIKTMGAEVFILTLGDKLTQSFKVYKNDLHKLVPEENIYIVDVKNEDTYRDIFTRHGLEDCIMVGNSLRSDINPSLKAGMYAIHVDQDCWKHDNEPTIESNRYYRVDGLLDVPDAIRRILRN